MLIHLQGPPPHIHPKWIICCFLTLPLTDPGLFITTLLSGTSTHQLQPQDLRVTQPVWASCIIYSRGEFTKTIIFMKPCFQCLHNKYFHNHVFNVIVGPKNKYSQFTKPCSPNCWFWWTLLQAITMTKLKFWKSPKLRFRQNSKTQILTKQTHLNYDNLKTQNLTKLKFWQNSISDLTLKSHLVRTTIQLDTQWDLLNAAFCDLVMFYSWTLQVKVSWLQWLTAYYTRIPWAEWWR